MIKIFKIKKLNELGLLLLLVGNFFDCSSFLINFSFISNILIVLGCFFLIINFFYQRYNLKKLLMILIIILLSLFSSFILKSVFIFQTVLTVISVSNLSMEKISKLLFSFSLYLFIFQLILFFIDLIFGDSQLLISYSGRVRISLGFVHPNLLSLYIFNLIILWIWINYDKMKLKNLFIILLLFLFNYFITDSRTTFIISIAILFIIFFTLSLKKGNKFISFISKVIFPTLSFFYLFLSINFWNSNSFIYLLDDWFSGRFKLSAFAYFNSGITFFTKDVNFIGKINWDSLWKLNGFTFDSTYSYLLFSGGLIWIIILSYCFYKLSKLNNKKINLMILAFSLYALTEIHPLNCFFSFPVLVISELFRNNYSMVEKNI